MSDLIVEGQINSDVKDNIITFIAAAPTDMRASYTGSGLPFTSPSMAIDGTPNRGTVQLGPSSSFKFEMKMPNSYYAGHGTVLVPPTVYLNFEVAGGAKRTVAIKLEEPIPYRTLTYQNGRTSASFYDVQLPVRSQERILRDSAYPTTSTLMPANHWGLKPPC